MFDIVVKEAHRIVLTLGFSRICRTYSMCEQSEGELALKPYFLQSYGQHWLSDLSAYSR